MKSISNSAKKVRLGPGHRTTSQAGATQRSGAVGLVLALSLLLSACSSGSKEPAVGPSPVVDPRPSEERLVAGIERRLALGLGMGFAAALRNEGKTSLVVRGMRSVEPPASLAENDVFEIGSVSKAFTGILVHLAVLENKLTLTTRLSEVFPSLNNFPAGTITISELALHTSGLPRTVDGLGGGDISDPMKGFRNADSLEALERWKKPAALAERSYSNWGYVVLGQVLEKVYRRPYAEVLKVKLVAPLRLGETAIDRGSRRGRQIVPKVVTGFDPAADQRVSWTFPEASAASGGVEMSAREMRTLVEFLERPGSSLIGRAVEASLESGIGWDSPPGAPLAPSWVFPISNRATNAAPRSKIDTDRGSISACEESNFEA